MQKFRTKKFWISVAGVIILMLQLFGVRVDAPYVNEVVNSVCAACILVGLMDGGSKEEEQDEEDKNSDTCSESEADNEQKDE